METKRVFLLYTSGDVYIIKYHNLYSAVKWPAENGDHQ